MTPFVCGYNTINTKVNNLGNIYWVLDEENNYFYPWGSCRDLSLSIRSLSWFLITVCQILRQLPPPPPPPTPTLLTPTDNHVMAVHTTYRPSHASLLEKSSQTKRTVSKTNDQGVNKQGFRSRIRGTVQYWLQLETSLRPGSSSSLNFSLIINANCINCTVHTRPSLDIFSRVKNKIGTI